MPDRQAHPRTAAILVAAGGSTRMGAPKQLLPLRGVPVIARTLRAFEEAALVDDIVVVARAEDLEAIRALGAAHGVTKPTAAVPGGATRQQSVARGVAALPGGVRYVAIHDGARPLVRPAVIDGVIAAAYESGAATAAVRTKDTVKIANDDGFVASTPDRSRLWNVQTPQVFERGLYERAMREAAAAGLEFTDDCQLVERLGRGVRLCEADYANIKITTPEDLAFAEGLLGSGGKDEEMRIGHGYDVHRLVEGRRLLVGGVEIPYEKGLLGHSDADVLAHAVADALLGAAGLGDIGGMFPDTDPAFEGADSIDLLRRAAEAAEAAGYRVGNVDATVVAQRPKMKDYIPAMRDRLAAACKVEADRVNVKATTEEGLGFTGGGEGMAAHAVCLLEKAGPV